MLRMSKSFVLVVVCLAVVLSVISVMVLITRASNDAPSQTPQASAPRAVNKGRRNLSLQPEASRVARQLGKRFGPSSRSVTAFSGQLSIAGSSQQALSITRRQTDSGEMVDLSLANHALTWNAEEGAKTNAGEPSDNEGLLVERLILDSPDREMAYN